MRPPAEFTAQTTIHNPGTGVRSFNAGDDVPASTVENWQLVVGVHVLPANVDVVPRPAGNARRADWEAYWIGQGLTREEVDDMSVKDMADREPVFEVQDPDTGPVDNANLPAVNMTANPDGDVVAAQATEQTNVEPLPEPGPKALKDEWVAYAIARGMPETAARESTVKQLADTDYDHLFGPG